MVKALPVLTSVAQLCRYLVCDAFELKEKGIKQMAAMMRGIGDNLFENKPVCPCMPKQQLGDGMASMPAIANAARHAEACHRPSLALAAWRVAQHGIAGSKEYPM